MKCPNCGKTVKNTGAKFEERYRIAMLTIHMTSVECPANIIKLDSGEEICRADKYLISRHSGGRFYTDDKGNIQICGLGRNDSSPKPTS